MNHTKRRILHIAPHLGGGAGKAISGLLKRLDNYDNTVVLLEEPRDITHLESCRMYVTNILLNPDTETLFSLCEEYDAVILNWWSHPLEAALLNSLGRAKTRLAIWSHINGLYYPYLPYEFMNMFDGIMLTSICTCENPLWTREQAASIKRRMYMVYGSGDFLPSELPCKKSYNADSTITIGYVGTMDFGKMNTGFPLLCSILINEIPNVQFVFYGSYSEEFRNAFLHEYPQISSKIKFMGFSDSIQNVLPDFDIFCYPLCAKNYATTENALIEALAAGLPVVVLNNPAERSIIQDNVTGMIADDIYDMAAKIKLLCSDAALRHRLGYAAREAAIKQYSPKANSDELSKCIENMMGNNKRIHDFSSLIGNDIKSIFLYFCGSLRSEAERFLNGDNTANLPNIFFSKSKSSPYQFEQYFSDFNK